MNRELFEEPSADVIWSGRPEVGICAPDAVAALCAFVTTFAVLSVGLAFQNGWAWELPLKLGAGYAALVGGVTLAGRACGGGLVLTVTAAFWAVVTAAALLTTQDGMALLCPAMMTAAVTTLLVMRFRERRVTRYQLTSSEVLLGQQGRFLITFPLQGTPTLQRDVFGRSLGDVVFDRVDAKLVTQDGKVIRLSSRRRHKFSRVLDPQRLIDAVANRGA